MLVLEGEGVPRLDGMGRGNLIVQLEVEIPKKLSRRQRELLEEYADISQIPVSEKKGIFQKLKEKAGA